MGRTGTTKSNGQKHDLDKFYTKTEVAVACLEALDLDRYARIIEPSAGAGAFSNLLLASPALNVLAFDLEPEHPSIVKHDWFAYTCATPAPTLVVGNPPFGQQCNLAVQFINHAFEVVGATTVAFILPRSFRKSSVQARVFANAHLVHEVVLPANSFELDGQDYSLNTVFQVWERSAVGRPQVKASLTSEHFSFTKKSEAHDFAIRRVGGKAGFAFVDCSDTSAQSNYFVKLSGSVSVADVMAMVNGLDFSVADDGTGPRSLSKRELVELFDAGFASAFPSAAD